MGEYYVGKKRKVKKHGFIWQQNSQQWEKKGYICQSSGLDSEVKGFIL